jgi:hypothetical protein
MSGDTAVTRDDAVQSSMGTDPLALRALTVHQPYARDLIVGAKRVENRPWVTPHRGLLLIHAGHGGDGKRLHALTPDELPLGVIVGAVILESTHVGHPATHRRCCALPGAEHPEQPAAELWHWVCRPHARFPEPVPHRGQLQLWAPKTDTHAAILAQLGKEAAART